MKNTWLLWVCWLLFACQATPTVVTESVVNSAIEVPVLVDTRSAFDFAGFHIAGSVNLNSGDFLILKDPKAGRRVFDPDLEQTIERLAKRGVSPLKPVILLGEMVENRKWNWLLKRLEIKNIEAMSLEEYRARRKTLVPQATPESVPVWPVKNTLMIIKESEQCFVTWNEKMCR